MKVVRISLIYILTVFVKLSVFAQSLPVGTPALEDYFRREQLMSKVDTNVSMTVRPLFPAYLDKKEYTNDADSVENWFKQLNPTSSWISKNGKDKLGILPLNFQTQLNTNHPYGWNDGAMIPARGLQTFLSTGIYGQFGPLSIQLRPEFVVAQNESFSTFNPIQYDVTFARYYDIYNNIDLPVRFGTKSYYKAFWGQSSIRLNFNWFSFGVSTENLWWGPGIRNSLLMSNTAPGFPHITLNTLRPVKTPIGTFEAQLIGGRLENSGFPPLEPDHYYFGTDLYVPKPNDWRYITGLVFTWQPKWVPGLFLGFDQSSQSYGNSLSGIKSYLPLFLPFKQTSAPDQSISKQDQLSAAFMRWIWPQEHAEIYFEYGQYDNTQDVLQQLLSPNNSRAYIFGLRKILPFNHRSDENIMISVEVTQLQETTLANEQKGQEWYGSQSIRQGYTNLGQELGAGIGPGGNLQSAEVSWIKGLKRLGLQLERYVHDNDFYYYAFSDSHNYSQHWVDLSLALTGEWNYKNLIFNAKLAGINSLNYQWATTQNGNDITYSHQINVFNLQAQAGITYRF